MTEDDQMKAFQEDFGVNPQTSEPKGKGYIELLVDNIVGLDNDYESFGEAFGKSFNEDELGTLKNMALSAYEGAKEFVTSPVETTKDVAAEISDSVSRLGAESLDGRIKRMYGVGYQDATEEQVTKAREAVIGDAITASSLIPAAKGATTVAKAAIPGKVQADVVGQMRSLIDGDKEFRTESTKSAQGLSAQAVGAPYRPKMFSSGEVGVKPGAYSVAEFYSPVVETLRNTEFPSKGYLGKELVKLLQNKTPGVRKAELDTMNLGIEDQKRYTKEEILDLAQRRAYRVTAEVQDADVNQDTQRQIIRDKEVDYATIKINATPATDEIASFFPIRGYTHYDPETIAHTRLSVREDSNGAEYMLVEELQSDLLQHGAAKPRGPISTDDAYEEVLDILAEDISKEPDFKDLYENNQKYFDNLFKVGAENSRQYSLRERGIPVPQEELDNYNALVEETKGMADNLGEAPYEKGFQRLATFLENAGYEEGYRIERRTKAIGPSPLTETSDAVRLTLQAAMAKAADSDVKSLVIPNVQRIIAADRARPGSEEYEKYVQPGSGFQRTYVKGVEKFIKQLQSEYGDAIKVERVELPYVKEKLYFRGQELDVPNTAIKIDFSGLKDVDLRVGRFAEGGMVEEDQMKRLMQEGGMTDDGMNIEPVTGNEIPPGSLSSEVRDDIPAQLSEGEYIVPADVVRFFGVRFFEELRNQAKQGLAEMDADGRIGGTPVDSQGIPAGEGDEELTPEEQQMLMEALGAGAGMAEGGLSVPMSNPYQDQTMLYQPPKAIGNTMPLGMAEGGDTAPFDRTQFSLGTGQTGIEQRKYINPTTKEERTINFLNGTPLGIVPEGFVPWTQELADAAKETETETPTTAVEKVEREGRDRDQQNTGTEAESYEGWAKENFDAITSDPYSFGVNAINEASKKATGLGRIFSGGIIGDIQKLDAISDAQAALSRVTDAAQKQDLQSRIEALTGSLSSPVVGLMTDIGFTATGKQKNAALDRLAGVGTSTSVGTASVGVGTGSIGRGDRGVEKDISRTTSGRDLGFGKTTEGKSVSTGTISTGGDRRDLGFGTSVGKADTKSTSEKGLSMGTSAGTSSGTSPGRADRDQQGTTGGANATRRATGGLVSKKNPSKPKSKKGLAS